MKKLILPIYFSAVLIVGLLAYDAYQSSKLPPMPLEVLDWLAKKNNKNYIGFVGRAQAQIGIGDYPTDVPTDADSALGAKDHATAWSTRQWPFPSMWSYFDGKMPNRVDANSAFTTNNSLIRADGAGRLIKQSPVVVDDAGNMTGVNNISPAGTVDGRDVATDGVKLDGIEDNADVTDTANVQSAGAVMALDYGAQTILQSTTSGNPTQLTVTEQTVVGRATGGNIAALAIDSDISTVSVNHDTVPSALAVRNEIDAIPGGGDVTGPASSTANQIPVFSDATGKNITNSTVLLDPVTGDMSNINTVDLVAKPDPGAILKDSNMPGVNKQIGGVIGQYVSSLLGEGDENTYVSLTNLVRGAAVETGTIYNGTPLADGAFKGDLIMGYNCGVTIALGQLVTLQNDGTNPWILADSDAAGGTPAHGIAMNSCTLGQPLTVMIKGLHRSAATYTGAVGAPWYLSTTPGSATPTKPSASGNIIQIVGYRHPNTSMFFDFGRSTSRVQ